MPETKVGVVTHYFGKVNVAIVKLTDGDLSVGDTIHIKGHTTDHTQQVESMQVEHEQVDKLEKGQEVGLKIGVHVHEHDEVFKVID